MEITERNRSKENIKAEVKMVFRCESQCIPTYSQYVTNIKSVYSQNLVILQPIFSQYVVIINNQRNKTN